jgi:hypothetical protein
MQILMTKAAFGRVGERLTKVAPDAQVVTASAEDVYERDGQPIAVEDIDPEVVWLSLDSWTSGTLGQLYGRLMKSASPRWTQIMAAGIDNPIFRNIIEKGVRLTMWWPTRLACGSRSRRRRRCRPGMNGNRRLTASWAIPVGCWSASATSATKSPSGSNLSALILQWFGAAPRPTATSPTG